ncbi:MAG: hypothetical protein H7210_04335, partial [Pyrinomonadaceae bacterium]|nr:hypothetical protein [Phycisphaerales bacterium]
ADNLSRLPAQHDQWDGYAELCLYLGDKAAYRAACEGLLEHFATDPDPGICERTGRACLLGPASPAQLAAAAAAIDRAMASEQAQPKPTWRMPYYRVASALAAYRLGDSTRALSFLDSSTRETLGPMPMLVRAMAQHQLGQSEHARDSLAAAVTHDDWNSPPDGREKWIYHILRREAEAMLRTTQTTTNAPGN